jgi:hypothetical protein
MDDGDGSLRPAAERLRAGLLLKQLGRDLGERLRVAEALGKDRLEVEAVILAAERMLASSMRARGGAPPEGAELDEVKALDGLSQARQDLRSNGAVQLVLERLLCAAAPSVLEQRR